MCLWIRKVQEGKCIFSSEKVLKKVRKGGGGGVIQTKKEEED